MHIQPTQNFLLARVVEDINPASNLVLPEDRELQNPHFEVIRVGPDCKFTSVNDRILLVPENAIRFSTDGKLPGPVYIIPESAIFAKYVEVAG